MTLPHVPELLLILVIVLLIFGAGKLPNVAGSMGQAIRDFRKNVQPEDDGAKNNQSVGETEDKSRASST